MKRWWLGAIVGAVVVAGIGGLYASFRPHSEPQVKGAQTSLEERSFHDNTTGTSVNYPDSLSTAQLSEADEAAHYMLRLQPNSGQSSLVTVRYETGVHKAAALTHVGTRDLLLDSTKHAFPQRYPGYQQVSERTFDINGHEAAEVVFHYEGSTGESVTQRFVILLKDQDTAIYVAAQAKTIDFKDLDQRYFNPVIESVKFE